MELKGRDAMWMARAIALARKGKGRTSPNPAVGAVIVKKGKIIGEGYHKKAGKPHAEVEAIRSCKSSPKGGVMYVTLEPCNHYGKTPACTEAIMEAGLSEVVIGSKDLSPKEGIRGAARLKKTGVKVRVGALKDECDSLITDFIKHSVTGTPFVLLKTAVTLDGKISTDSGDSRWISSDKSRKLVHKLRNEMDAVMIGSWTAVMDDPLLTVRYGSTRKNPLRVIADSRLRLSQKSNLIQTANKVPTIVFTTLKASPRKIKAMERTGAEVVVSPSKSKVNLKWMMNQLGKRGVMSVLLEGSGKLAGAMIKARLVDRVMFFIAPKIVGGGQSSIGGIGVTKMEDALELENVITYRSDVDIVVEGDIIK